MHWETRKFLWLNVFWCSLYCFVLEPNCGISKVRLYLLWCHLLWSACSLLSCLRSSHMLFSLLVFCPAFFTGKTPTYSLRFTSSDTFSLICSSWGTFIYLNSLINLFPLLIYKLFIFAFLTSSELSDVQWEPNNICWRNSWIN